jgi:two-component system CheB/CheR fusion protein
MPQRPPAPDPQELLQLLLDQGEEYALFFMTPDGTVTDWFAGAEHVFGYTAQEMVGRSATLLFNSEDRDRGAEKHEFELAVSAGRADDDRWHVRKDGTRFWGSGVLFALRDKQNQLVGFAKMMRNRTDVKTYSEALENQVKALARAHKEKDLFLGVLGHELRTPISALANAVEILRRSGPVEPMALNALQIIDRQAAVIRRLTDDLMDTTRLGAGKVELELQLLDLKDVFHAAAATARPLAQARKQDFQVLPIAGAVPVRGDAVRLHQVFMNLLDNAIKYTPEGGKIHFNMTTEGGDAITRVEDTGLGMSADILPKVFELFTQEESSRKAAQGGLGLGLPLVRDLVELHSGTVNARSDGRGKGSVFTVRLPLHGTSQS